MRLNAHILCLLRLLLPRLRPTVRSTFSLGLGRVYQRAHQLSNAFVEARLQKRGTLLGEACALGDCVQIEAIGHLVSGGCECGCKWWMDGGG